MVVGSSFILLLVEILIMTQFQKHLVEIQAELDKVEWTSSEMSEIEKSILWEIATLLDDNIDRTDLS